MTVAAWGGPRRVTEAGLAGYQRVRNSRTSQVTCAGCDARDGRVVARYRRVADGLQLHVCCTDCLLRAAHVAEARPVIW